MKYLLTLLILISIATSQGRGQRLSIDEQITKLDELLVLNDAQKDTIKSLIQDYRIKMGSMRDNMMSGGGDRASMMESFRTEMKKHNKKIVAVLNDKQKLKYEEYIVEQMENRQQRRRN